MSLVPELVALRILSVLCLCSIAVLAINNSKEGVFMNDVNKFEEKRLLRALLTKYQMVGIVGRPVYNASSILVVEIGLGLYKILDFHEKNQVLTTFTWLRYTWDDQVIRWDPGAFNEITEVRLPTDKIWTPDIRLYNHLEENMKISKDNMAVINYRGKVLWVPPAIFKSTCEVDIKYFPFDQQTCHLKFGSWTYDGFKLDIQFYNNQSEVNIEDYTPNDEWRIIARHAVRNVKFYPCCAEPYPDLTFYLTLRRKSEFFANILILPAVLLSCLTLVTFWLPPNAPAKPIFGLVIFFGFFLLLLFLADSIPFTASSSMPYIGQFYCFNMVIITLSTFLSAIVINIHSCGSKHKRLHPGIRKVFYVLGRCFCMCHAKFLGDSVHSLHPRPVSQELVTNCSTTDTIEEEKGEMLRALKALQTRFNDKDAENRVASEWQVVALILDRLFFCFYLVVIILAAAILLRPRFPSEYSMNIK